MGRDLLAVEVPSEETRFNPRARMGRDKSKGQGRRRCDVSIHAPVWGATGHSEVILAQEEFQSTRPYGARRGRPD